MAAAYEEDLAYVHDVGFGDFARDSAPGLLAHLRQAGIEQGRIVDLGCGSGILAEILTGEGYSVVGCDLSAAMIRIARKRAPCARFQVASYLDFELPSCRAVTCIGECFNYLFDERNDLRALKGMFRRIHSALQPGGLLLFDVAEPGRNRERPQVARVAEDWAVFAHYEHDLRRSRLTRHITTFRQVGARYRRSDECHRLRLYRSREVATALREVGFRVRPLRGYGDFRFLANWVGFVARRA